MDTRMIAARFKEAGVALGQDDTWRVQQATVIKHAALERLAAACEIIFDPPTIVRAQPDEAVMCVTGRMGDKAEWSFGEARVSMMRESGRLNKWGKPVMEPVDPEQPGNYVVSGKQAAYPYAMAEKRAKDRVIIKLVGLHGAYSSEEAEAFREKDEPEPVKHDEPRGATQTPAPRPPAEDDPFGLPPLPAGKPKRVAFFVEALCMADTPADLKAWWAANETEITKLADDEQGAIKNAYVDRLASIKRAA